MANNITLGAKFNISGDNDCAREFDDATFAQTNLLLYDAVLSCTTSDTALSFGSISGSALGWLLIENLDPTNYITVGPTSGGVIVPCMRVEAGKWAIIYVDPTTALRVQANTATCKVRFTMYAK